MAVVAAEERTLPKTLSWRDGFMIALSVPAGVLASLGFSIGSLGAWGAAALWGICCLLGLLQNYLFAEMAAMFPEKPGGVALYAHEAWRKYFSPIGPICAFGYWMGWSFVLSIFGLTIGQLVTAQWFPGQTWTFSDGVIDVGLPHLIGAATVIAVWALNVFGLRPAMRLNWIVGVALMAALAIFIIGPFVTGNFDSANLHNHLGEAGQDWGGLKLAMVWLFLMGWSGYATEICATFAPEYKDTRRDTFMALRTSGIVTLAVLTLLPVSSVGAVGEEYVAANPASFYVKVFQDVVGSASGLVIAVVVLALFMSMNASTGDASRALFGLARDGMTIKQLNHLNHHRMPGRAMTLDLVVNLGLLFFVGNVLGILFASNVGYITAIAFSVGAYALLRKDRPDWPRPIKLSAVWAPLAVVLAVFNAALVIVGVMNPSLTGYGGTKETVIGFALLLSSLVFFLFRRLVQDKTGLRLQESTPTMPEDDAALAAAPAPG
jgi:amino acid transporter